jgi:hypothetical protein
MLCLCCTAAQTDHWQADINRWPDGVAVWLCEATRKDDAEAGRTEDALKVAVAKALADSNKYPNASAAAPN